MTTVGIMSAGAMGSAVGAAYLAGGARVVTTAAGRSPRTARLAQQAGLEVLDDVAAVVAASDLVLSVVPPGQARAAARELTGARLLVEANAVSPATVQEIASYGPAVVDGSISGGPPGPDDPSPTRLYLSGPRAQEVADVPAPWLDVRVVGAAGRHRLRDQDVHGLLLQGTHGACRPGAADGARARRDRRGP